ncbi:plpp-1.1 [Pristionchus pacificus]|uniref:AcidPPc domain-containing protein n=1 Tax=Pristionchus pacificus TaxID=54126 RepID=A0A2A6CIK1_PRIPA|nr:plpp-1.1 [Pristionchus pacificus]|eukprot:PDM78032.1 hypothetical protein PRIPAC_30417 [Pristionchus pacificus]
MQFSVSNGERERDGLLILEIHLKSPPSLSSSFLVLINGLNVEDHPSSSSGRVVVAHPPSTMQISISRLICDFVVLCCCALPLLIFQLWVKPYKRGFYCDDESIRYPFRESTVSRHMLIVVGLIIPTALIFMTEIFRTLAWERKCAGQFKQYRLRERGVHRLVVRLYVFMGYFLVGVCFNQVMVDIAKYTIGRHRPHFMDVCKPNVGYSTCTDPDKYITDFNCTGSDPKKVHESMLSFYSGHSAFSFYGAWFTSLYLQARLYRPLYSRLVLPVIQVALFGGATFVAYSRVSDYKHHWSDVLVGIIMGSALGIFVALVFAEVFKRREIPSCDEVNGEFGLIRLEPREGQTTNAGCHNCGAPQIATHSITVTNEYDGPTNGAQQRLVHENGKEEFKSEVHLDPILTINKSMM